VCCVTSPGTPVVGIAPLNPPDLAVVKDMASRKNMSSHDQRRTINDPVVTMHDLS
jgi:hypothetical protein